MKRMIVSNRQIASSTDAEYQFNFNVKRCDNPNMYEEVVAAASRAEAIQQLQHDKSIDCWTETANQKHWNLLIDAHEHIETNQQSYVRSAYDLSPCKSKIDAMIKQGTTIDDLADYVDAYSFNDLEYSTLMSYARDHYNRAIALKKGI